MKDEITSYIENLSLLITGVFLLIFPIFFLTATTDPFALPKQIILAGMVFINLILLGVKMVNDGEVRLRRTPFDLPILLFLLIVFFSSIFSLNRFDSLASFVPFLFMALSYFVVVNLIKSKSSLRFLIYSLLTGASILSIISFLSLFKIYILPLSIAKTQTFSPLGSIFDQAIYLGIVLPIALYLIFSLAKKNGFFNKKEVFTQRLSSTLQEKNYSLAGFAILSIVILIGFLATLYNLATFQKPIILPFETGFQTAFAAISQDTGRIMQGFFLGSGIGTYVTDFARFKQAAFNLNQSFWSLTFFRSSSFVLEVLATTGFLGTAAFIFLIIRIFKQLKTSSFSKFSESKSEFFISLILIIIASFFLPFSFTTQALLFLILGLFAASQGLSNTADNQPSYDRGEFYDIVLNFVAFKKGIIPLSSALASEEEKHKIKDESFNRVLPAVFLVIFAIFVVILGFFSTRFVVSDILLQRSLVAAAENNGGQTYQLQNQAITTFPFRDAYYRIFSQTNLALANSLAASQPKNSSPSAQVQQTIYTLIQQSINSARTAISISPITALNWQNLSSIYRSLIGFGQNAENFALLSSQQAVNLDPNNPQQYINLGGIYYQLDQWDNAQRQFQIAINLKPDFANAYYNLGHVLENKQDYQSALSQYQIVKTLVANDQVNSKKITEEIETLQKKITETNEAVSEQANQKPKLENEKAINQPPLGISTPSAKLPEQKPPVKIPAPASIGGEPKTSPTPTPKAKTTPLVSPTPITP